MNADSAINNVADETPSFTAKRDSLSWGSIPAVIVLSAISSSTLEEFKPVKT